MGRAPIVVRWMDENRSEEFREKFVAKTSIARGSIAGRKDAASGGIELLVKVGAQ